MIFIPSSILRKLHEAGRAASQLFDDLADHERALDYADRYRRRMVCVVGELVFCL